MNKVYKKTNCHKKILLIWWNLICRIEKLNTNAYKTTKKDNLQTLRPTVLQEEIEKERKKVTS